MFLKMVINTRPVEQILKSVGILGDRSYLSIFSYSSIFKRKSLCVDCIYVFLDINVQLKMLPRIKYQRDLFLEIEIEMKN